MNKHLLREVLAALQIDQREAAMAILAEAISRIDHPGVGPYTDADKAFIRANFGTMSYAQIGAHIRRPTGSINTWCYKQGLCADPNPWKPSEIDALFRHGAIKAAEVTGRSYYACKGKMQRIRKAAQARKAA